MTTQPQRRHRPQSTTRRRPTRRPTRRPARRSTRQAPLTLGAKLVILGIILLVTLACFHDQPGPTATVVFTSALIYTAITVRPRRALPQGAHTLQQFLARTPAEFEHDIARLALRSGASRAVVKGGANDRGMDVDVTLRDGRRVLIQCKRYTGSVGSEHVQIVNGTYRAIHGCDLALIVTTGTFTAAARATNDMLRPRIRLVDGPALTVWANGGCPPWS